MSGEGSSSAALRVAVLGPQGRMGQEILAALEETAGVEAVAAIVRPGHPSVGQQAHPRLKGLRNTDDLAGALRGADVLVDFTHPEATLTAAPVAAAAGVALVVGTTGMTDLQKAALAEAAAGVATVFAPNMSVGVNVMVGLLEVAARALSGDFDVEVFEMHHRGKADAPSGTALRIAEALCDALGRQRDETLVYGRRGFQPRQEGEIGMQVARGGTVAGEHTVFFLGQGERLEITHRASSRRIFADGAVRAALWVASQPPGFYDMSDVLGLSEPRR